MILSPRPFRDGILKGVSLRFAHLPVLRPIVGLAVATLLATGLANAGGLPRPDPPLPDPAKTDPAPTAPPDSAADADSARADSAPPAEAAEPSDSAPADSAAAADSAADADSAAIVVSPPVPPATAPDSAASKTAPTDRGAGRGTQTATPKKAPPALEPLVIPPTDVVVSVVDIGEFTIRMFTDQASHHVATFLSLAGSGAYDSLGFHRVIPGMLIQTGDVGSNADDRTNEGRSAPTWRIPREDSDRTHVRGTVSMAWRGEDPGSAGSQWFVTLEDIPGLDGHATPIGEVVAGMDVVERVSQVSTLRNRHPLRPVRTGNLRLEASSGS